MPSKKQLYHMRGIAARSLLGGGGTPPPELNNAEQIIIDPDTNEVFADALAVSFSDLSSIIADTSTPANNKNSKTADIYDFFYSSTGSTYKFSLPLNRNEFGRAGHTFAQMVAYSRDFSNAYWTKSSVDTIEYLTGELDQWGDEKVQRVTWTGSPGGGQYFKSTYYSFANRNPAIMLVTTRMPVGETATLAITYNTTEYSTYQITGTGDWVTNYVWAYSATGGLLECGIRSKAGDTAQYVDVKNLYFGSFHGWRGLVVRPNDSAIVPRHFFPVDYDSNNVKKGLYFTSYNSNTDILYGYIGYGSASNSGSTQNGTLTFPSTDRRSIFDHTENFADSDISSWVGFQKFTENTADAHHTMSCRRGTSLPTLGTGTYQYRFLLGPSTRRYLCLMAMALSASDNCGVYVDLQTKTVTDSFHETNLGIFQGAPTNVEIETYSDGTVSVTYAVEVISAPTGQYLYQIVCGSDRATVAGGSSINNRPIYVGSTSHYFHACWPSMWKHPVKVPPHYHGTSSQHMARVGFFRDLTDLPWSTTEGTLLLKVIPNATGSAMNAIYIGTSNNTVANLQNCIQIGCDGSLYPRLLVRASNVTQVDITHSVAMTAGVENTIAVAWKASDFALTVNGETATTQLSGSVPTISMQTFWIGNQFNNYWDGWIKDILYVPSRKNDNWLKNRSANF